MRSLNNLQWLILAAFKLLKYIAIACIIDELAFILICLVYAYI